MNMWLSDKMFAIVQDPSPPMQYGLVEILNPHSKALGKEFRESDCI